MPAGGDQIGCIILDAVVDVLQGGEEGGDELPGLRVVIAEILCGIGRVVGIRKDPYAVVFANKIYVVDRWVGEGGGKGGVVLFIPGGYDMETVSGGGAEGWEGVAVDAVADLGKG